MGIHLSFHALNLNLEILKTMQVICQIGRQIEEDKAVSFLRAPEFCESKREREREIEPVLGSETRAHDILYHTALVNTR